MAKVRLTKNGLREEELKLKQLKLYLPTLQLKKSLLQVEVQMTQNEIDKLQTHLQTVKKEVEVFSPLLTERYGISPLLYAEMQYVEKNYENIAGVEIPNFQQVIFREADYSLFETPAWFDASVIKLRELVIFKEKLKVTEEKKRALYKELRDVSIRVNLFEKVLIPRTEVNIKKIKIFLGDQELSAVAQAKVAKNKILQKGG